MTGLEKAVPVTLLFLLSGYLLELHVSKPDDSVTFWACFPRTMVVKVEALALGSPPFPSLL